MKFRQEILINVATVAVSLASLLGFVRQTSAEAAESCPARSGLLIIVERLQEGFAGQTGERTIIDKDGCFTVYRMLNGEVILRLRSGQLGPDRMLNVREAIDAAGIASFPDRTGSPSVVNPALVSVTYGGVTKTVGLPAGISLEDLGALGRTSADDPSARLARLAVRLLELTNS